MAVNGFFEGLDFRRTDPAYRVRLAGGGERSREIRTQDEQVVLNLFE